VRDPLLSFLVEVNWSKGRMLREYNVLLDPPVVAPAIATRAVTTPVREPEREGLAGRERQRDGERKLERTVHASSPRTTFRAGCSNNTVTDRLQVC
jgi:pilus assembly protein FimV